MRLSENIIRNDEQFGSARQAMIFHNEEIIFAQLFTKSNFIRF
jgi:hypothetical protein